MTSSYSLTFRHLSPLQLSRSHNYSSLCTVPRLGSVSAFSLQNYDLKLIGPNFRRHGRRYRYGDVDFGAFDADAADVAPLDDWGNHEESTEFVVTPVADIDLPVITVSTDESLTVTARRFALLGKQRKKHRIRNGVLLNAGLIIFLVVVLLYVDWCAWRIVRLPLAPFHLTCPFFISAALAACAGYVCVPFLYVLKIRQIIRIEGPARHSLKKRTPTMGGLFFVPVGVIVAKFIAGFSSVEVSGVALATLAFAAIGLLDDTLSLIKNHNTGLSAWTKIILEENAGSSTALGLVCLGKCYLALASFCFVSMGNGVNLTDGLDGLAGGTAALAFIGMSIAVLPVCSDLAIFGASMAGACVGFLLHNRYKASVFMGDTGSLALGGGLAAMACCTGMFFPLFVSSGIFIVEALSVILQVLYFKTTKRMHGAGRRLFRMAPFHHHLELCGLKEPVIVGGAYVISSTLALCAGYLGLISA
ncbi:phospho-N-acetylmuramoyl-pentapeptide-transferase homolog [Prunus yedoensis var. nudiflora]|uniref:Phospho-N-acetylmuramoyl-pentapeptide-transferase homolog n=1 Tax=Prunus yedoensis var. nudiflora TaxID=2094558 RepID=A0A314YE83_PRUYE|nr:phospho-N-acetylmuramoyl-pentapeptide-transferase homolog [Prunus yedoensis var. nudiflora]